jgi:hypothetical protein
MIRGVFLFVVATVGAAQAGTADLSFVSCWARNGAGSPVSRSVTSSIVSSQAHWRAYATVTASANEGSCRNTTRLWVAGPGQDFVLVFTKAAEESEEGNGIRILGWSPSGTRLLAEVTGWANFSDAGLDRWALVYEAERAVEVRDVSQTLVKRFGDNCLFDYSVIGWKSESTILVRVRPSREAWDDRRSCVTRPRSFAYQLESGMAKFR